MYLILGDTVKITVNKKKDTEKQQKKIDEEDGTDRQRGTIDQKQTSTMFYLTYIDHR